MLKELKNYTIISKIASGGMSEVYLAIDTNTGKEVALKILDPKLSIDPEYIHRFKKEASISSQLNHKNIVKILSYGTFKDNYYIAYEYIEGITLDKYIKQKSLSISEIENISIQILEALYYAHSNNIIHRDIKPSNIMIAKGTVKILDFGIAKQELAATVTKTGLFMGSPHYVSPEQIEGHDIDYRSDIYSFGIVLYEMIEGKVPFSSDTPWGIIRAHLDKSIPEITRDAPTYLKEIVKKCLFKKKEYRFRSAQEIIYLIKNKEEPEEDKTVIIERGNEWEKLEKIEVNSTNIVDNLNNNIYDNRKFSINTYSNIIPLWKILLFSFLSFGFYFIYWFYINCRRLREIHGTDIKPGLRTAGLFVPILSLILIYNYYKDIRELVYYKTERSFSPGLMITLNIFSVILSNIYSYSYTYSNNIDFFAIVLFISLYLTPMLVVQNNFNKYWAIVQFNYRIRHRLTAGEIVLVSIFALYLLITLSLI
jgi:serine/threonine protein kinase